MNGTYTMPKEYFLHGANNFSHWKFALTMVAKRLRLEEFLETDVVNKIKANDYRFNPNGFDATTRVVTNILKEIVQNEWNRNHFDNIDDNNNLENMINNNRVLLFNQNKNKVIEIAKDKDYDLSLLMIFNMETKISSEVNRTTSSFRMFEKLKEMFGDNNNDTEYWLKKLSNLKANDRSQIMKTANEVKKIFGEMEEANVIISEREKLKYIYNILPDDFKILIDVTLNTTANELYDYIKERISARSYLENWDKNKIDYYNDPMDVDLLSYHNKNKNKGNRNYKINKKKSKTNMKKDNRPFCHICEERGHSTRECRYNTKPKNQNKANNKGRQSNTKQRRMEKIPSLDLIESFNESEDIYKNDINFDDIRPMIEKDVNLVEIIENENTTDEDSLNSINKYINSVNHMQETEDFEENHEWYYDIGRYEHIINNKSFLKDFKKEKVYLRCANNSVIEFEGYGSYEFCINDYKFNLKRVLYSEKVNKNLFSAIELAKLGIISIIKPLNDEKVRLELRNIKNKHIGYFESNNYNQFKMEVLYKVNNNSFKKKEILSVDKTDNISKEIWHRRLGHFYQNNLNKYLEMHNIKSPLCIDCKISKMKRIAHNGEPPKAKEKLEVIHSDISGPVNPSIDNKKYFITFMDEFSRKVWIFTLKSKSEAPDIIIDFFKYLNNQFKELSIKKFRTDGGKEYKNKKINKLCKEYGIEKLYSAPYNPEINGKAERINQTLVNAAISLLHWAGMSENFWEYAIKQACYIYKYHILETIT